MRDKMARVKQLSADIAELHRMIKEKPFHPDIQVLRTSLKEKVAEFNELNKQQTQHDEKN